LSFRTRSSSLDLRWPDDYVALAVTTDPEVKIDHSEVVFVGYGIVAPQYNWDDYKATDVKGKVVLILAGDPSVPDERNPLLQDERVFKGKGMSFYGRPGYKYEVARQKGAAAAFLVHDERTEVVPFELFQREWTTENFGLKTSSGIRTVPDVVGWIRLAIMSDLVAAAGEEFEALRGAAERRDFRARALGDATIAVSNTIRELDSRNVIARIPGSDPALKNECLLYSAHWDHLGRDPRLEGDQVFNGAMDNASGVAALLEIADAFTRVNPPPRRSILFLFTTSEEQGFLGARQYAMTPVIPLEQTAAVINIDGVNHWGRTSDVISIGYGNSTLDDVLSQAATAVGRTVTAADDEDGNFYRADQIEFTKRGVPALFVAAGDHYLNKPPGYGYAEYQRTYHTPADEVTPEWDLSGAVDDARLLFDVGMRLANAVGRPEWKSDSEFRAIKDLTRHRGTQ
jgi:Zn-dependent M28 family amino/carboxypeptidase